MELHVGKIGYFNNHQNSCKVFKDFEEDRSKKPKDMSEPVSFEEEPTKSTLIIILGETRAHELTFDNFKKNLFDQSDADLCVCIGVKHDYDYNNPFYKLAKYKFLYNEPHDFAEAFDYSYENILHNKPKYECLVNRNGLYGNITNPQESTDNVTYYGNVSNISNIEDLQDDEVIVHTENFPNNSWKGGVYGIKQSSNNKLVYQENVITYKKHLHWYEFLKIKNQFLGGIKDKTYEHKGSAGILIFFRWFLLKKLVDNNLIKKYKRFIITRSDFIYRLPHPKLELLDEKYIWIPNDEYYGGYTDRHVILPSNMVESYLNILNNLATRSCEFYEAINKIHIHRWNLEKIIKLNLERNGVCHLVKEIPYIMYSVRNTNGFTRWRGGIFYEEHGYYVKYHAEYTKSLYYKNEFDKSGLTIEEFYKIHLPHTE